MRKTRKQIEKGRKITMALYRCAACGSPNVVTDTQIGGLKYDYLKGAVGTAILGAGGAAA